MSEPGFNWMTPVLYVEDMVKSLEHYQQVLGFNIAWQWSDAERFDAPEHPTFACVARGECSIFLCEKGQGNPGTWICFSVSNHAELDQIFEEYKSSGADIAEEPQEYSWGMREMIVKDIDENVFRIGCRMEEDTD